MTGGTMILACTWREGCDGGPAYPLYTADGKATVGVFCQEHARQTVCDLGRVLLLPSPGCDCRAVPAE